MGNCCRPVSAWETPKGRRLKRQMEQERILIRHERQFDFESHNVATIYYTIKGYATDDRIPADKFMSAGSELKLGWIVSGGP